MISTRYYYKNWRSDEVPEGFSLFVTGVGRFRLTTLKEKMTDYASRNIFQVLFIKSGVCRYIENGCEKELSKGGVLVWHPGERRQWSWRLEDKPDVYWVEFGGPDAEKQLLKAGLWSQKAYKPSETDGYAPIFEQMMQEMLCRQPKYCELCAALLQQFIFLLSRDVETAQNRKKPIPPEVLTTVRYMEEHYRETVYLDELAAMNYIGKGWLIKQFKRHLNMSPMKYLNFVRMEKAVELLQENNSIDVVAKQVGFSDRLYFSKVFKAHTGVAPGAFQKGKNQ